MKASYIIQISTQAGPFCGIVSVLLEYDENGEYVGPAAIGTVGGIDYCSPINLPPPPPSNFDQHWRLVLDIGTARSYLLSSASSLLKELLNYRESAGSGAGKLVKLDEPVLYLDYNYNIYILDIGNIYNFELTVPGDGRQVKEVNARGVLVTSSTGTPASSLAILSITGRINVTALVRISLLTIADASLVGGERFPSPLLQGALLGVSVIVIVAAALAFRRYSPESVLGREIIDEYEPSIRLDWD